MSRGKSLGTSGALLALLAGLAGNGEPGCQPAPVECVGEACACDGRPPEIVITEILPRTASGWGCAEWFELYNPGPGAVDLHGWSFEDAVTGARVAVSEDTWGTALLPPGAYGVVSEDFDSMWCLYRTRGVVNYRGAEANGEFSLGLYEGGVVLRAPTGRVVDAVVWDRSWGFEPGRSLELVDPRLDNAVRSNWRPATYRYGWDANENELFGTPGSPPASAESPALAAPCDDSNACTVDYCLEQVGCTHALAKDPCDDGNPCTDGDRCIRSLVGAVCVGAEGHACDDGCVEGEPCDDGDPCTVEDTCLGGRCRGRVPPRYPECDDPNAGYVTEGVCRPEAGGFGYPILSWWNEQWQGWEDFVSCSEDWHCTEIISTACGAVTCWQATHQCAWLPY